MKTVKLTHAGKREAALFFAVSLSLIFLMCPVAALSEVTSQDILDGILGRRTFTAQEWDALDLNQDGKVNVSDMVYFRKDNPVDPDAADYIFILSRETMGVEGNTAEKKGFPPTLLSRSVSISLSFADGDVSDAALNIERSVGLSEPTTDSDTIPATSLSHSSGSLEMAFEYDTLSESFGFGSSLTNFDASSPSLDEEDGKILTHTLILKVNDFDVSAGPSPDKTLEGTFSFNISGVLTQSDTPFFQGTLMGIVEP